MIMEFKSLEYRKLHIKTKHLITIGVAYFLLSYNASSQTEAWPQFECYWDYSVWYSEDRPATDSMVLIPGGTYKLGFTEEEKNKYCSELGIADPLSSLSPPRVVELAPFYILKHEVCNKQYLEFLDYTYHRAPNWGKLDMEGSWPLNFSMVWRGRTYPPGRTLFPITSITKADAEAFCKWRTEVTGVAHRLPTEDEFEAALRGHKGSYFPWGSEWSHQKAVPVLRNLTVGPDPIHAYTDDETPLGVKHLLGNVSEFTSTMIAESRPNDSLPISINIIRKGCYQSGTEDIHTREEAIPSFSSHSLGFRYVIPIQRGNSEVSEIE